MWAAIPPAGAESHGVLWDSSCWEGRDGLRLWGCCLRRGQRGWQEQSSLAGKSQGITAGSLGMELLQGMGREGVALPGGGLVCGEQVERLGLGKMKVFADCGKQPSFFPFPPSKTCLYP